MQQTPRSGCALATPRSVSPRRVILMESANENASRKRKFVLSVGHASVLSRRCSIAVLDGEFASARALELRLSQNDFICDAKARRHAGKGALGRIQQPNLCSVQVSAALTHTHTHDFDQVH